MVGAVDRLCRRLSDLVDKARKVVYKADQSDDAPTISWTTPRWSPAGHARRFLGRSGGGGRLTVSKW